MSGVLQAGRQVSNLLQQVSSVLQQDMWDPGGRRALAKARGVGVGMGMARCRWWWW